MSDTHSIVVAGGGIGGLAAAAALAGHGMRVTVVERAAVVAGAGAGLMLQPNGVRALDAIGTGLGRRVRAAGNVLAPDAIRILMDADGTVLARERLDGGPEHDAPHLPILRTALHDALLKEAVERGATLQLATAVVGCTTAPDAVHVRLSDDTTFAADALIAADGINSRIRHRMLGDGPPAYRGYTSVRGHAPDTHLGTHSHVVNGRGVQLFIAPVGDGHLYWTAKITAEAGAWPAKGPARALDDLTGALSHWYAPVARTLADTDPRDVVVTDIHDRDPALRWTDGRVTLLGDAAHPMVPALGQGANTALEDAVVLADTLAGPEDVPEALLDYQRERLPRTSAVVLLSRGQGELDQGADARREHLRNTRMRTSGRKDEGIGDILGWRPPDRAAA
ncbi:FAD-dependent monooxygenase [Streptomyces sp. NPDC056061]|uniref:FAD-dependent monooxygenase n=1 Tax=Streptomyces sp. NPDC056061 TaxID=3345700 RepID=UPI0035E18386